MEIPEPTPEHLWLKRLIGEWTLESGGDHADGEKAAGTETIRALGDFWVVSEYVGTMHCPGEFRSLVTIGYDPVKGRFVGSWIGSVMTMQWVYDGELSEDQTTLDLFAEGPDFEGGDRIALYRDRMELRGEDHRVLISAYQTESGEWKQFMELHFRRAA